MSGAAHLARRFVGSISRRPPDSASEQWAVEQLLPAEAALWRSMPVQDRRHTIAVSRRFVDARPTATRAQLAASLLHDIGKTQSGLGTFGRVAATIVGPRTRRLRLYHDHERLGAAMLAAVGSAPETVALVAGSSSDAGVQHDLRAADDV